MKGRPSCSPTSKTVQMWGWTSAAQLAEDAVVRDGFADHGSRERLDYDCEVCDSLACF